MRINWKLAISVWHLKLITRNVRRAVLTKWLKFCYRNQDDSVCCCGADMDQQYPGISCNATCRSMKEYVITSEVNRRIP